jgi:hypothetical protein
MHCRRRRGCRGICVIPGTYDPDMVQQTVLDVGFVPVAYFGTYSPFCRDTKDKMDAPNLHPRPGRQLSLLDIALPDHHPR